MNLSFVLSIEDCGSRKMQYWGPCKQYGQKSAKGSAFLKKGGGLVLITCAIQQMPRV